MAYTAYDAEPLISTLRLLMFLNDYGIYETTTAGLTDISEDDYYEIALNGLANIAPYYQDDEIPMYGCDEPVPAAELSNNNDWEHWHTVYHFSSPEMQEYYRLCRLYEYREDISPEENPYVGEADNFYIRSLRSTGGDFAAGFDSDHYTTELVLEICPEYNYNLTGMIEIVGEMLDYYKTNLAGIKRDIMCGPLVFLPQLPAPKPEVTV